MAAGTGHTTNIFANNGDGYFAATVDDGDVRIGLEGEQAIDIPAGHEFFDKVSAATDETVEDIFDDVYSVLGIAWSFH